MAADIAKGAARLGRRAGVRRSRWVPSWAGRRRSSATAFRSGAGSGAARASAPASGSASPPSRPTSRSTSASPRSPRPSRAGSNAPSPPPAWPAGAGSSAATLWWRRQWPNAVGAPPHGGAAARCPLVERRHHVPLRDGDGPGDRARDRRGGGVIGLCTDSNSQLSPELRERFEIVVVPITIDLDGQEYLEGVDLDADAFYARFARTATARRSPRRSRARASSPSPTRSSSNGGVDEILSIHIGSAISGTLNSARLAAHKTSVPVRLVDTGVASFGIACCMWAAAEAIAAGAGIDEAATVAESLAPQVGNVFTVSSLELVRAGGRAASGLTVDDLARHAGADVARRPGRAARPGRRPRPGRRGDGACRARRRRRAERRRRSRRSGRVGAERGARRPAPGRAERASNSSGTASARAWAPTPDRAPPGAFFFPA